MTDTIGISIFKGKDMEARVSLRRIGSSVGISISYASTKLSLDEALFLRRHLSEAIREILKQPDTQEQGDEE